MTPKGYAKSTLGLRSGDFCFVPRTDGRAALFVYLYPQGKSRSYFFGALAKELLAAPNLGLMPAHIVLTEQALLHIECFAQNQTPVAGNILDRIDTSQLASMEAEAGSHGVGAITRVWGYRIVLMRANAIAA